MDQRSEETIIRLYMCELRAVSVLQGESVFRYRLVSMLNHVGHSVHAGKITHTHSQTYLHIHKGHISNVSF